MNISFIEILIAIAVVYIAWQNYRIEKNKLRFDLYDKRLKIYNDLVKMIEYAWKNTDGLTEEKVNKFEIRMHEAKFLFGIDVNNYIFEVNDNLESIYFSKKSLLGNKYSNEEKKMIEHGLEITQSWFEEQIIPYDLEINKIFKKYLKFTIYDPNRIINKLITRVPSSVMGTMYITNDREYDDSDGDSNNK
ncbi:hypothetical protein KAR28_06115 [Candidatus Parcubacteria bacterium]|nr:hypothetical protein [Candidatus Parcubacteria bacterium]